MYQQAASHSFLKYSESPPIPKSRRRHLIFRGDDLLVLKSRQFFSPLKVEVEAEVRDRPLLRYFPLAL
jgi:hypothetical protein